MPTALDNNKHPKGPFEDHKNDFKLVGSSFTIQDSNSSLEKTTNCDCVKQFLSNEQSKSRQIMRRLGCFSLLVVVIVTLGVGWALILFDSLQGNARLMNEGVVGQLSESPKAGYDGDSPSLEPRNANYLIKDSTVQSVSPKPRTLTTTTPHDTANVSDVKQDPRRPNVLLLIVDDLKPAFSAYKSPLLPSRGTPNIDRLVQNGVSFMNAHCQMSVCGPSRASFLTSLRPDTLGVYTLRANALHNAMNRLTKKTKKQILTLPTLFKLAGYNVYGVGKIFHENEYVLMQSTDLWTGPLYSWVKLNKNQKPSIVNPSVGLWVSAPDVPDDALPDGQAAKIAVNLLRNTLATNGSTAPFFLALGLYRPHLPWIAPKKYFDMCAPISEYHGAYFTEITTGLTSSQVKLARGKGCGETHVYKKGPKQLQWPTTPSNTLRNANRAYHASILYADAQIGLVLDALEESPAGDNTIVVLLSDHGFHLGDKGLYCKKTNYEQATKVPVIISVPRLFDPSRYPRNEKAYAPVELLDLMPTLYDLASLNVSLSNYYPWQGESLVPMLQKPSDTFVKQAAVSQYFRRAGGKDYWGYSIRTVRYRYTRWYRNNFEELYDYLEDDFERVSMHKTKPDLKSLLLTNGYYNKDFAKGAKLVPFDFQERFKMEDKPPCEFA